ESAGPPRGFARPCAEPRRSTRRVTSPPARTLEDPTVDQPITTGPTRPHRRPGPRADQAQIRPRAESLHSRVPRKTLFTSRFREALTLAAAGKPTPRDGTSPGA